MSTTTYDPFDIEAARRRVCIKRALRRAGVAVPREREVNENEAALMVLAAQHGIKPLSWEEVQARLSENDLTAGNIDPALCGLPQDSEIGPEIYPEPPELIECRSCRGYGYIKEEDESRRICLDCSGAGEREARP